MLLHKIDADLHANILRYMLEEKLMQTIDTLHDVGVVISKQRVNGHWFRVCSEISRTDLPKEEVNYCQIYTLLTAASSTVCRVLNKDVASKAFVNSDGKNIEHCIAICTPDRSLYGKCYSCGMTSIIFFEHISNNMSLILPSTTQTCTETHAIATAIISMSSTTLIEDNMKLLRTLRYFSELFPCCITPEEKDECSCQRDVMYFLCAAGVRREIRDAVDWC